MELRFAERERARIEERNRTFNELAQQRAAWVGKGSYYHEQVRRVVASLVLPGSRVLEVGCGLGDVLAALRCSQGVGIDVSSKMIEQARARHADLQFEVRDVERDPLPEGPFDYVIFSEVVGQLDDIQRGLEAVAPLLSPQGRLVVTYYNFLWEPLLKLASRLRLKAPWPEQNWLSMKDIENLIRLSGYEVIRTGTDVLLPIDLPLISEPMNKVVSKLPVIRNLALMDFFVARKTPVALPKRLPSTSVICPCRNERGNIQQAIERTPVMGSGTELIFVDGNSGDGTVEEIQRLMAEYQGPLEIRLIHQGEGKGKGDAVRKGFAAAKNDVLMILDADLTVAPEDLPKFYAALVSGKGEFINGVRSVYPMEGDAMRFLNVLGNKFFSGTLGWLLEQPIKDSLCGTKALYRVNYERIAQERSFFGNFDPFGDFDLLFGAARLNLKIVDLPVRYRARIYGETKIDRFRDGWILLKMTAFGFKAFRTGTGVATEASIDSTQ